MTGEQGTGEAVRGQYEAYPYPPRNPADEAQRLIKGSPSNLWELNHYCFGGRLDLRQPFRALVAGCGTGDAAIMLAHQLATSGCPAEVECIDLSDAALAIVEARAKARGLRNLRVRRASLLELDGLGLGRFDYIDCCGVLHHLDDPPAGLAALKRALAPGGGIGLMVYAPLGRAGVYEIQALLRLIGRGLSLEERIDLASATLAALPEAHLFKQNKAVSDHRTLGRAGIVDLLLHARDRAYFVPELLELVADAGLAVSAMIEPARYQPENYVADAGLRARFAALTREEAWTAAELVAGDLKRHTCYLVEPDRLPQAVARPDSPGAVPLLSLKDPAGFVRRIAKAKVPVLNHDNGRVRFDLPPWAGAMLAAIDGRRTLADIHATLGGDSYDRFKAEFDAVYAPFNAANAMYLRYLP
jgi:SAM-dependent methyltransferase